jgi:predicted transcriptional regulator
VFYVVQAEKEAAFAVRGRIDILADILEQAREGSKKTRIMYACNLSFRQLRVYLDFLVRKGFLSLSASGVESRVFKTTRKGLAFLRAYAALQAVISS